MTDSINLKLMTFEQPIGKFGLSVMDIYDLISISTVNRRTENPTGGIQRNVIPKRVADISKFVDTKAEKLAFPTPIILSLPDQDFQTDDPSIESFEFSSQKKYTLSGEEPNLTLTIPRSSIKFAEVIDGQHRLAGIAASNSFKMRTLELSIPVLFVIEPTLPIQAYLFATINGNQKSVPYSFIADLFALHEEDSVEKFCHQITSELNSNPNSPLKNKIKMLGIKTANTQSITQGSIVRELVKVFDERKPLNKLYTQKQQLLAYKILLNMLSAAKATWEKEWEEDRVLTKTVGFVALIKSLPKLYEKASAENDATFNFFCKAFKASKESMIAKGISINSEVFPSNGAGASKLSSYFIEYTNQ